MADSLSFPPIDPTSFDLIVVGTGLPESIVAAASSTAGKSVLHLDPNPFYGSHYASLSLHDLISFLHSHSQPSHSLSPPLSGDSIYTILPLYTRPLYSDIEISSPSDELLAHSRKFSLDLSGPRVLFCADSAVDLLLKSGANQYVEFKNIDASFIGDGSGRLWSVPDSKSGVFKDKSLGFIEKNQLNGFFKLVLGHFEAVGTIGDDGRRISEEDMESPFVEFLEKMRLSPKLKSVILYAIAMADYDQDNGEACTEIIKTKDGIDRLALYHSSVGRFHNALGALIYPIYGLGELPQAFCRSAAVKGCLYVLRMPVVALLADKVTGSYVGVKLASGQELLCSQLVMDPSFIVRSPFADSPPDFLEDSSNFSSMRNVKKKLARGICIAKSSLKPDVSNCLVIYPPKSLYPEQMMAIRVIQLGSNLGVCPPGMFVFYVSARCGSSAEGKTAVDAAFNALFLIKKSGSAENASAGQSENIQANPVLLWKALYLQELTEGSSGQVGSTPMPDGNLNYNDILDSTVKLFLNLYPDEEIFPPAASREELEVDGEFDMESS